MKQMIKNIVFDIGNVLITFEPDAYLRAAIADGNLRARINQAVFLSPEWLLLDQGAITEDEALQIFQTRCPEVKALINGGMDRLYEGLLRPMDENIAVVYELKRRGYPVYLLSNYNEKAFDFISKRNAFPHDVDGRILSFEVNTLKPAPAIYHALLDRYRLRPEETVFIDDSIPNVRAAEALGIRGIHYTDQAALKMDLEQIIQIESGNHQDQV
jgi:putative hydrolase of the HAD superfamily